MPNLTRRAAVALLGLGAAGASVLARAGAPYEDPDDLYAALRRQPGERIALADGTMNLVFADGARGLDRGRVRAWARRNADSVSRYFDRFPVKNYGLLVIAEPGGRVGHATTFGYAGSATRIHIGVDADDAVLARDWVGVHEMLHAALPNLPRRALWLQEGNATWVEPVARARAGHLPVSEVWRQAIAGMPKGEPDAHDRGLDGTTKWNRLYWGGAVFWLLAEIAIAEQSRGRRSLRDAMRAANRQSGGNTTIWSPERLMAAGDTATGTTALSRLYARFANTRVTTDLDAMFARLGVAAGNGGIVLDDRAPLAALRHRLTA